MSGRSAVAALVVAGALLVGGTAVAGPVVQVGSADRANGEGWVAGVGYNFEFPLLPFGVGVLAQAGSGPESDAGRVFPARAFVTGRVGVLPMPGFNVYLGGGAGAAFRLGGDAEAPEARTAPAGIGFGGFEVGRLHLEVQFQREFREVPLNRWVTAVGVSF